MDAGLGFRPDHGNFISHIFADAEQKGSNRRRLWGPLQAGPHPRSLVMQAGLLHQVGRQSNSCWAPLLGTVLRAGEINQGCPCFQDADELWGQELLKTMQGHQQELRNRGGTMTWGN